MNNIHVTRKNGVWRVISEGAQKAVGNYSTQKEAIEVGREMAKRHRSELVIHRPDGRIRDKDSYGNDPCPPVDKKH